VASVQVEITEQAQNKALKNKVGVAVRAIAKRINEKTNREFSVFHSSSGSKDIWGYFPRYVWVIGRKGLFGSLGAWLRRAYLRVDYDYQRPTYTLTAFIDDRSFDVFEDIITEELKKIGVGTPRITKDYIP
jgi:hypothetical protein